MFRPTADRAPFAVSMLLVAQLLPGLLATPYIGGLVDARDAGRLLAKAALANAVVVVWMACHPVLSSPLAEARVLSILFAIGGTASFLLIPVLAKGSGVTLARANAVLEFVWSAEMLAAPVVGGMLLASGGAGNGLLIDAASSALLRAVIAGSGVRQPVGRDADAGVFT